MPALHDLQEEVPTLGAKVPIGHWAQTASVVVVQGDVVYLPMGHTVQAVQVAALVVVENVLPATQPVGGVVSLC